MTYELEKITLKIWFQNLENNVVLVLYDKNNREKVILQTIGMKKITSVGTISAINYAVLFLVTFVVHH